MLAWMVMMMTMRNEMKRFAFLSLHITSDYFDSYKKKDQKGPVFYLW